ncbi:MAG TPA: HEAT repeat domain-containing protein [Vicinamibacterales bacterium]|nr:HEAT repeat domain-containing protein [Vicinamibacterales bacterium]
MSDAPKPPVLSPEGAAQLADFARACKAAARAVSLYPAQHPAIVTTLDRLADVTARLTAVGPARLQVSQHTLLVGDATLAKPDQTVTELAALLHRHLIGAVTVNAGADASSWRTLLLLLARSPEDVRADGGIAHLWATAGGPSIEVREVNYAEVLRERRGTGASLDDIIAAALEGAVLDDEHLDALLAILGDPARFDELLSRLELLSGERGSDARTAVVLKLLQSLAAKAGQLDPRTLETTLQQFGQVAARLSADEMVQLLAHRQPEGDTPDIVGAMAEQMRDDDVAQFVAASVIAEHGATARLAHAFQALVPDTDRQRRLLALAEDQVAASPLGEETSFAELWGKVESMVTSYSDASYVSEEYGRELSNAQAKPVDVERTNDDPPERITAWLTTVNDSALRGLDHQLLQDLLSIEEDPARWRDVAETTAAHAEDLVRVGHFDQAWKLADAIIIEAATRAERGAFLSQILERFGRGSFMKHVAAHLRHADDKAFARFERLCRAIGTPVIAPLAETLSTEQDARSRRRLRDVLVGFGAQGRDVVQQLMNAPNWEVRRTAAFLLREFGGSEGLRELIPLLTDNEPLVQREAVQALVLNGSDEAAAILVKTLDTVSGRARETLVAELTQVRDQRAAPLLCYLVRNLNRSTHAQVYLSALEALGTFPDPAAVDVLKDALHRGDLWAPMRTRRARAAAAATLRRIGTPQAIDTLQSAARTGSRGTRAAARAHLTGLA